MSNLAQIMGHRYAIWAAQSGADWRVRPGNGLVPIADLEADPHFQDPYETSEILGGDSQYIPVAYDRGEAEAMMQDAASEAAEAAATDGQTAEGIAQEAAQAAAQAHALYLDMLRDVDLNHRSTGREMVLTARSLSDRLATASTADAAYATAHASGTVGQGREHHRAAMVGRGGHRGGGNRPAGGGRGGRQHARPGGGGAPPPVGHLPFGGGGAPPPVGHMPFGGGGHHHPHHPHHHHHGHGFGGGWGGGWGDGWVDDDCPLGWHYENTPTGIVCVPDIDPFNRPIVGRRGHAALVGHGHGGGGGHGHGHHGFGRRGWGGGLWGGPWQYGYPVILGCLDGELQLPDGQCVDPRDLPPEWFHGSNGPAPIATVGAATTQTTTNLVWTPSDAATFAQSTNALWQGLAASMQSCASQTANSSGLVPGQIDPSTGTTYMGPAGTSVAPAAGIGTPSFNVNPNAPIDVTTQQQFLSDYAAWQAYYGDGSSSFSYWWKTDSISDYQTKAVTYYNAIQAACPNVSMPALPGPSQDPVDQMATVLKWVVVGLLVVGGIWLLWPMLAGGGHAAAAAA